MHLVTASLNSGSNGNCYYIGNAEEAVLIDAGISCRETEKRMKILGLPMQKLRAIFISHEHSDHIRGLELLSRKYQLPVYITPATQAGSRLSLASSLIRRFEPDEPQTIGNISVTGFRKLHDAADPHSFVVSSGDLRVGVFTDIGAPCSNVIRYFRECQAAYLEANYDDEMLERGNYPFHLKRRIRSELGHLSNDQALRLFLDHGSDDLRHVFLSHLSRDNNCPEKALNLFQTSAGRTRVAVASRYGVSEVYTITKAYAASLSAPIPAQTISRQATLF